MCPPGACSGKVQVRSPMLLCALLHVYLEDVRPASHITRPSILSADLPMQCPQMQREPV